MTHPNLEFMQNYFNAWLTGNLDTVRASFNEDLEVHLAGKSSYSGVYRGVDNFFDQYVARVYALTSGNAKVVKIKDILANAERAVVLAEERFERPGKVLDVNRFLIYEFTEEKISQIWEFEDDLYAVDDFFDVGSENEPRGVGERAPNDGSTSFAVATKQRKKEDATAHPNEERTRKFLTAWSAGELDVVRKILTDDVEVHIPGRTPLAGVYRGLDAFFNYADKVLEITGGKTEQIEVLDLLANDERAVVITNARFERPGKELEYSRFFTFDFRGESIFELWVFDENQYLVDDFFSSDDEPGSLRRPSIRPATI